MNKYFRLGYLGTFSFIPREIDEKVPNFFHYRP